MGVPFEALLPYGIMLGLFGFSGAALSKVRHMQNGGKRARHSLDRWDRHSSPLGHDVRTLTYLAVMDRDRRLTGYLRGQTDNVVAPPGFELNNPWRMESRFF
ncbi:NADH dehydrogenase [ubiquinone] (complex I), alpha subcomplex subunit 1 [Lasallia pustulata]|uniref:NADH dehydrogenase [ubiquinone] 1 alpha subcomplex subunit 1 n=1 Tax=Lasallia pustulata TaxID=136370 RepID=A0A1W5CYW7_9LECA|nr:NADH dehydrogenase [ubiquinone] (complex I), alpha subcomplex subunit 1 [Lasallia pustulata]